MFPEVFGGRTIRRGRDVRAHHAGARVSDLGYTNLWASNSFERVSAMRVQACRVPSPSLTRSSAVCVCNASVVGPKREAA